MLQLCRCTICEVTLEQDGLDMNIIGDDQIHPEVATLLCGPIARGNGLLASAYGPLFAAAACERLMTRYASYARGRASITDIKRHALPAWILKRRQPVSYDAVHKYNFPPLSPHDRQRGYLRLPGAEHWIRPL